MKVNTKQLKQIMKELSAVAHKDQSALLSHVFFNKRDDELLVEVSDGTLFKSVSMNYTEDLLEFDCSYVELNNFLKIAGGEDTQFTISGESVILSSEQQKMQLKQFTPKDSTLFDCNENLNCKIDRDIVISDSVFSAIDTKNRKFELNGMLIDLENKALVATDTRRLAVEYKDFNITVSDKDIQQVIVPKKALIGCNSISNITFNKNFISFINSSGVNVRVKLIAGKYPEYKRIIPKQSNVAIQVNGLELKSILKKIKSKDLQVKFTNNCMHIAYYDDVQVVKVEKIDCDYNSSLELVYALSATYLYDAIVENEITMQINDYNLPITIQSKGIKSIIMPIIVDDHHSNTIEDIATDLQSRGSTFKYKMAVRRATVKTNTATVIRELIQHIKEMELELEIYKKYYAPLKQVASKRSSLRKAA